MFKILPSLLSVLLLAVTVGCSGVYSDPDRVKIGVNLPLSGQFAPYGRQILQGMELYRQEAAARGVHFDLVVIDNTSEAGGVQLAFRQLVEDHHVQVVVGAYSSTNTFILKPLALKYRVPVVTPTATNDEVTARNPYVFRTCFNDSTQGRAIAWYLRHKTTVEKVGILFNLDLDGGDYSRGLAYTFSTAWENSGGKIVKDIGYRSGQQDYAATFREFETAGTQAIFAPLYSNDVALLLDSAEKNRPTPLLFGSDGWAEEEVLRTCGRRAIGSFYACMFADESPSPQTAAFVKLLQHQKLHPGMCIAQGYDTTGLLVSILKPGLDGESVRQALLKVANYPGVTGNITIKPDGNAAKQVFIKEIYFDKALNRIEDRIIATIDPETLNQ